MGIRYWLTSNKNPLTTIIHEKCFRYFSPCLATTFFWGTVIIVEVVLIFMHCTNTDNLRKQTESDLSLHPLCWDSLRKIRFQQKCSKLLATYTYCMIVLNMITATVWFFFLILLWFLFFFFLLCFEGRLVLFVWWFFVFFWGGGLSKYITIILVNCALVFINLFIFKVWLQNYMHVLNYCNS